MKMYLCQKINKMHGSDKKIVKYIMENVYLNNKIPEDGQ